MKIAILIGSLVAVLAANVSGSANEKSVPLNLRLEVVSEKQCQFTPIVQAMKIHARLKFVNSGRNKLAIQEIGQLYLIRVAKKQRDMERGIYEVDSEFEQFEPSPPKNASAFTLKSGSTFDTMETVYISVAQKEETSAANNQIGDVVEPGMHYLQIGEVVRLGDSNPSNWRTWRNVPVRSIPIAIRVDYSGAIIPACQTESAKTRASISMGATQ